MTGTWNSSPNVFCRVTAASARPINPCCHIRQRDGRTTALSVYCRWVVWLDGRIHDWSWAFGWSMAMSSSGRTVAIDDGAARASGAWRCRMAGRPRVRAISQTDGGPRREEKETYYLRTPWYSDTRALAAAGKARENNIVDRPQKPSRQRDRAGDILPFRCRRGPRYSLVAIPVVAVFWTKCVFLPNPSACSVS
jgi:hypothetical protein